VTKGERMGEGHVTHTRGIHGIYFPELEEREKKFLFLNTKIQIEFTRFLADPEFLGIKPTGF
jgi:hypothetical protein